MAEPAAPPVSSPAGSLTLPPSSAEREISPVEKRVALVRRTLANNMKGIEAVLGRFMEPSRFCRMIVTLCQHNPDLLKCEVGSIVVSTLRIAQLQLSPDPALGQAWLIPRKGRAEFQMGWKGYLALAYRSPLVKVVRFGVVAKGETFSFRDGREWELIHEPGGNGWPAKLEDVVAAWCVIELVTGGSIPRVMYLPELMRHKGRGQGSQPAWSTDPSPMCVKTVMADACRRGPFEGEIGRAFALDHSGETGHGQGAAIDAEFQVVEAAETEGNGKASKAETFKQAFGEPETTAASATEAVNDDGPAGQSEGEDPLGDALDDAVARTEAADAAQATPLLSREQLHQIDTVAAAKGMTRADVERACGASLDSAPAAVFAEILRAIRDFRPRKR